jgi:competence protein ComEA
MTLKEFVRDFCHFSRRDRIAIFSLIILCAFIWILPEIFFNGQTRLMHADTSVIAAVKKIDSAKVQHRGFSMQRTLPEKIRLFFFDPNTLDVTGWMRLGIRQKTAQTILKYISKGGKFRKKDDLKKIWGLTPEEYERIAPYVNIAVQKTDEHPYFKSDTTSARPVFRKYTPSVPVIDINLADTAAFIALPGIGSKLAARIVSFREKLGGFFSVEQVGEVYGLPDSTFQKIRKWLKVQNAPVRKININTATLEELKVHPYIRWNLANPIIAYRNEHGKFEKLEDLKNIMIVTEEVYNKVKNYLMVQ